MVVAPCPKTQNKGRGTKKGKEDTKLQFRYVGFSMSEGHMRGVQ